MAVAEIGKKNEKNPTWESNPCGTTVPSWLILEVVAMFLIPYLTTATKSKIGLHSTIPAWKMLITMSFSPRSDFGPSKHDSCVGR